MSDTKQLGECPICGRPTVLRFSISCDYRKPTQSQPYNVDWCDRCTYGQVWERPSKAQVAGFYQVDDYYTHSAPDHISPPHPAQRKDTWLDRLRVHLAWRCDKGEPLTPQAVLPLLKPLLKDDPFTLCEIGCGDGGNLLQFQSQGFTVTGVEPDPAARATVKRAIANIFDGTAESLPPEVLQQQYDIVLMSHVLEHCLDINAAVLNAKKIIKPGGLFIVETPNCQSHGFQDYQGGWLWSDIPRHLNFFTPASLRAILVKHGFSIANTKYHGFCRQFTSSWLQEEAKIWHRLATANPPPTPHFEHRAWKLLLRSIFSPPAAKYDSVRHLAVRIQGEGGKGKGERDICE
ncbi:MAG: class I SAM-dependent methyltransferase [Oculatellaceae cyanobacterium Prado106]|nr:class I SAM-dependent methyltransferase [Oculatellaceae cyanobacterium Prado106]